MYFTFSIIIFHNNFSELTGNCEKKKMEKLIFNPSVTLSQRGMQ